MATSSPPIVVVLRLLQLLLAAGCLHAVTFVREPNNRGPSAVQAGRECLTLVARNYLNSTKVSRTRNMVTLHSTGMSAPAADIEVQFLAQMHSQIAARSWMGLQLRIISNCFDPIGLIRVSANAITLTDYYVLVVDDVQQLRRSMRDYINVGVSYNPAAKFLIMYSQPSLAVEQKIAVAYEIFQSMFNEFGAAKVVICVSAGHLKYDIYLTDPYRNATNCGSLVPHLVGQCNDGRFVNHGQTVLKLRQTLVPAKMTGCVFNFCKRVAQPYVEEGCAQGLEIQMLKTMQGSMDFTQNTICSTRERGDRDENGSWTDLLADLNEKRCDMLVGGFFPDNDVHEVFAVTNTYMQDTYTWYVYLADFQRPWRGLVGIFEPQTWLLFFLILIIAAVAWLLLGVVTPLEDRQHSEPVLSALNTWAVFLSVSANNRPARTPLRVFFILLALYGLNVTTIYTSNLITMFTEPKHDAQINTIGAILASNLPIGGREECADWFENDNLVDREVSRRYNTSDAFVPRADNLERVRDRKQAMLLNRFYVLSSELRQEIYGISGNVFSNPLEMITVHGFPLLSNINQLINRMKDTGLVMKIYRDFVRDMNSHEAVRNARLHAGETSQVVLTVDHLQGAFAILIIGHLLSCVVFGLELLSVTPGWRRFCAHWRRRLADGWLEAMIAMRLAERPEKPEKPGRRGGGGRWRQQPLAAAKKMGPLKRHR